MSLDQEINNKIREALNSNKLDFKFAEFLSTILDNDDSSKLDESIAYHVKAKEGLTHSGLNNIAGKIYTARTTYRELLDLVNNPDFYYFQSPQKISTS